MPVNNADVADGVHWGCTDSRVCTGVALIHGCTGVALTHGCTGVALTHGCTGVALSHGCTGVDLTVPRIHW